MTREVCGDDLVDVVVVVFNAFFRWAVGQEDALRILGALKVVVLIDKGLEAGYHYDAAYLRAGIDAAKWLRDRIQVAGMDVMETFLDDYARRFQAALG